MSVSPSRRRVLQAFLAAALAPAAGACTSPRPARRKADPDVPLRATSVAQEERLLALYDAALATATPLRASRLQSIRDEHAEHLRALAGSRATATASAASPAAAGAVPSTAALVAAERAAAAAHAAGAQVASPVLAQLLASLSASEASHPVAL